MNYLVGAIYVCVLVLTIKPNYKTFDMFDWVMIFMSFFMFIAGLLKSEMKK